MDVSCCVRPVLLVITLTLLAPRVNPCPTNTFPVSWPDAPPGVPFTFYPYGGQEGDSVNQGTFGFGNPNTDEPFDQGDLVTIDLPNQVFLPFLGSLKSRITVRNMLLL